ncbi:LOW QUALITY PROTEIN: hypothetical protein PHMEG_00013057 [Phytophthora megakarya]|uniref:Integrase catalytic domain-containing protein n=1 Tax=Phytophthora megakarya TaxID=4795 RepID=A0A225W795_9STRA|nr:LOW QUALITY PROTEIN: hypothetical protein PHMEG_00013057 [Phytophthora megakarya]
MSTADHPQTDGQTERVNRVLVDLLKCYAQSFHNWSDYLPMAEFAINNAVHASTGHTPFIHAFRARSGRWGGSTVVSKQPQKSADMDLSAAMTRARARARTRQGDVSVPGTDTVKNHEQATPASSKDNVSVRSTDTAKTHAQAGPVARTRDVSMPGIDTDKLHAQVGPVARTCEVSVPGTDTPKSHTQSGTDATTSGESVQCTDVDKTNELARGSALKQWALSTNDKQSFDSQKLNADNVGRGNTNEFKIGSLVLLSTQNLPAHAVSGFGASKLAPRFTGPFTVTERHGSAYTLELPTDMRLHPTFYVGRLKPYVQPESSYRDDSPTTTRGASSASHQASSPSPGEGERVPTTQHRCGLSGFGHVGFLQVQLLSQLSALRSLNRRKSLHAGVGT